MKTKLITILILFSIIALAAPTRKQLTLLKNDVVAIKTSVKTGKNLPKSEAKIRSYLADSVYKERQLELQQLLCEVLRRSYLIDNEKMYLRQPLDTANLVNTGCRMFLAYQKLDSLDSRGRHRNSQYLLPYRANIFMGGLYFMHRRDWQEAWQCFDLYLQCPHEPLFSECHLADSDSLTYKVAFLSLVTAIHLDSLPLALKYADASVRSNHRERALIHLSEITLSHKDTVDYEQYLRTGFREFPRSGFFFPHLVDLLDDTNRSEEALTICDEALRVDTLNNMFLMGKHEMLMDMHRYDEAISVGNQVIALNDSLDTPYYNLGFIYHKKAVETLNAHGKPYRQRLAAAQKLLRKCRTYIEKYRQLRPYDRSHWRPILYDVYLNLNMGKEFAEIAN